MAFWSSRKLIISLIAIFFVLSAADLLMTRHLIEAGGGTVLESNPIANWCLISGGWMGLAAFKAGMVAVIGAVAVILTWHSKRISELVLVFACGAQSAIVLHSAFLDRLLQIEPTPYMIEMSGTDNPLLNLLSRNEVRKELRLTGTDQKALVQLAQDRQDLATSARNLSSEEFEFAVKKLQERQAAFLDQLDPMQAQRLRQIALQERGLAAFVDWEVEKALNITAEQHQAIRTLLDKSRAPEKAKRFAKEGKTDVRSQILAVLTDRQREQWNDLVGPPFRQDPHPFGSPVRKLPRGSW